MIFHSYVNVETRGYDGMMEPTVVKKRWTTMKDTGFTHSQCWFKMVWLDLNLSNMKKKVGWEVYHSNCWFHWTGFTNQTCRGRRNRGEEILGRKFDAVLPLLICSRKIWKEDHPATSFFFPGWIPSILLRLFLWSFPGLWLPRGVLGVLEWDALMAAKLQRFTPLIAGWYSWDWMTVSSKSEVVASIWQS